MALAKLVSTVVPRMKCFVDADFKKYNTGKLYENGQFAVRIRINMLLN